MENWWEKELISVSIGEVKCQYELEIAISLEHFKLQKGRMRLVLWFMNSVFRLFGMSIHIVTFP